MESVLKSAFDVVTYEVPNSSLEEFYNIVFKPDSSVGQKLISEKEVNVDGLSAMRFIYIQGDTAFLRAIVKNADDYWCILYKCSAESWKEHENTFDAIISGFGQI